MGEGGSEKRGIFPLPQNAVKHTQWVHLLLLAYEAQRFFGEWRDAAFFYLSETGLEMSYILTGLH